MKIINTGPITSETLKLLANKIGPMALIIEVTPPRDAIGHLCYRGSL